MVSVMAGVGEDCKFPTRGRCCACQVRLRHAWYEKIHIVSVELVVVPVAEGARFTKAGSLVARLCANSRKYDMRGAQTKIRNHLARDTTALVHGAAIAEQGTDGRVRIFDFR